MSLPVITRCPVTLAEGYNTYSRTGLIRLFGGRKVHHILPYDSPSSSPETEALFLDNRRRISISGVQEKYSIVQDKNRLRLARQGEQSTHILKPPPMGVKKAGQLPANEHLTMQIARQVFGIETAENGLIFFRNGQAAYLTRRFDVRTDGTRQGQEDFASLAGRTPQTHGKHYKYQGNYSELFSLLKRYVPAYRTESVRLLKVLIFNYLFSNGDAHLKNFSLVETPMGDYRLGPAYDLLNSRIHMDDSDFALEGGLLPANLDQGSLRHRFSILAELAEIPGTIFAEMMTSLLSGSDRVEQLINASYLDPTTQRAFRQAYSGRLKQLAKT
jgi:serine/threonine-protein kinase HipA